MTQEALRLTPYIPGTRHPETFVWSVAMRRPDMRLKEGDVKEAVAWFFAGQGRPPECIYLNPVNQRFGAEVAPTPVKLIGGCLRGEVWLK